ncbi:MAG: hypothetical protein ACR2NY_06700 [Alphaproteobacteria bacterium]
MMKKTFKQTLLASALIGLAGIANAKDGFYVTPDFNLLFVDSGYTKDNGTGVGFGGGLLTGYQINNFQLELAAAYQYYGGTGSVTQNLTPTGQQAALGGAQVTGDAEVGDGSGSMTSSVDSNEAFIPLTLGVNYIIPLNDSGSFSISPGIATGVWFHTIDRSFSLSPDANVINATIGGANATQEGQVAFGAAVANAITASGGTLNQAQASQAVAAGILDGNAPDDSASETKWVIVPALNMDYAISQNFTMRLAGKFYLVPSGYSDNYDATNQANAEAGSALFAPAYNGVEDFFWYGAVNLSAQYTF